MIAESTQRDVASDAAVQLGSRAGGLAPELQRILAAENALALAWQRLNTLRRAAFHGGAYDSAEFRVALAGFQAAEVEIRAARSARARPVVPEAAPSESRAAHAS